MKIYIVTDMEGVCGVMDHDNWVTPEGQHYAAGKRLLTREVNAAADGFFSAGATEIHVLDGHGFGGIDHTLLDSRVRLVRGEPFPYGLDGSFDAIAWVGQHAKAGTAYAHIAHTQWFDYLDLSVNGVSIGEFGQLALVAATFGIRPIFGAGDEAFCREAKALAPGIETVAVKKGFTPGSGDECDCEAYRNRNLAAEHLRPEKAAELIREGARKALQRFAASKESFPLIRLAPPYVKIAKFRACGDVPEFGTRQEHPDDLAELIRRNDKDGHQ